MSSNTPTIYFVSGANRGIGSGLVEQLVKRDNVLVFAGARDPTKATALNSLADETGRVVVVKLESTSEADAKAAAQLVKDKVGKLDYLIANAGISLPEGVLPVLDTPRALVDQHYAVNAVGPLLLFQAFAPLLLAAPAPHFVAISTAIASLSIALPFPVTAYGMSKAALNYLVVKIATEHGNDKDRLAAYAISPGFAQSDMGNAGAKAMGLDEAPVKLEDSVAGVLKLVDGATREKSGGKFWDYTGDELTW
ncbi:hypothetical protein JCM8208_001905 [Rhodotorula glutinis]